MRDMNISSALIIEVSMLISFISSNLFLFSWDNIIGYYVVILVTSFLGGAIIANVDKSLKLVSLAFIISCFVCVLIYLLPSFVFGEASAGEMNITVGLVTTQLARNVVISFPVSVFACLFGSFSVQSLV